MSANNTQQSTELGPIPSPPPQPNAIFSFAAPTPLSAIGGGEPTGKGKGKATVDRRMDEIACQGPMIPPQVEALSLSVVGSFVYGPAVFFPNIGQADNSTQLRHNNFYNFNP